VTPGVRRVEEIWGTVISIDVRADLPASALDPVVEWFHEVDARFSTWRSDSDITAIGHGASSLEDATADVREVLLACEALRVATGGAFDVTAGARAEDPHAPGRGPVDPSGFVKGWALERAATIVARTGARDFAIAAGGDMLVRGEARPGEPWSVGIQHPHQRSAVCAVLHVRDLGVATSGRYERGDHILDPSTGRPTTGVACATVVGHDLGVADAWATALMVLGTRGITRLVRETGYDAMIVSDDDAVTATEGFASLRDPATRH
jgi:thiamine biosynthesis lipoprotein